MGTARCSELHPGHPQEEQLLAHRLVCAAAQHGQRLKSVLLKNAKESEPVREIWSAGDSVASNERCSGTIMEKLGSGLQVRISPLAFFSDEHRGSRSALPHDFGIYYMARFERFFKSRRSYGR